MFHPWILSGQTGALNGGSRDAGNQGDESARVTKWRRSSLSPVQRGDEDHVVLVLKLIGELSLEVDIHKRGSAFDCTWTHAHAFSHTNPMGLLTGVPGRHVLQQETSVKPDSVNSFLGCIKY